MYKTPVVFLALGTIISTSAFSSDFLHKILPASKNPEINMMISENEPTRVGVDFSGTWSGSCKGEKHNDVMIIKNTDYGIEINGQYYDMNSIISEGSSHANWYENNQFRITWNENHDKLTIQGIAVNDYKKANQPIRTDMFEITIFMKGDKLVSKGSIQSYKNLKLTKKLPYHCSYTKQD